MEHNFINVRGADGIHLHTIRFPHSKLGSWSHEKPRAIIFYNHAYGSHTEKNKSIAKRFQDEGIEVIGYDMRGFGRSGGKPAYIGEGGFHNYYNDSRNFLSTYLDSTQDTTTPLFGLGYSLGACSLIGFNQYVARRHTAIEKRFSGHMLVSP